MIVLGNKHRVTFTHVKKKGADQFRMVVDDLGDAFPGEGFLPESSLDVI